MMNDEQGKKTEFPSRFIHHGVRLILHPSSLILLCAGAWTLTLTAPLLSAFGFEKLSFLNYLAFHAACHQKPDRSFWILGAPMAVCARCSGLYAGTLLGLALSISNRIRQTWAERLTRSRLALCCLPLVGDVAFHAMFRLPDPAPIRAATGLLAGAALFLFLGVRLFVGMQPDVQNVFHRPQI